ncbi:MAG: succinate-semialdehyde dehydrogenase/glutarate-semialdehyde dehydrogenase [Oleispira sp.]|jgi:succinate-semialdehyde dehydrogenase/glutarate-semialdehyde dehydrogenase
MTDTEILNSIDPSSGEIVGSVTITNEATLKTMVERAAEAQLSWGQRPLHERSSLVQQAYAALEDAEESMAMLISREMGKDTRRAGYEASGTLHGGRYLAAETAKAFTSQRLAGNSEIQYRPVGIVAVISPWNYPLAMANNLIVPALVAGNSVILKPSEETPLVADMLVNILNETLPSGVLQIAHGGGDVGEALVKSNINMVAFTGSLQTGRNIMATAAPQLKRLVMELGGNDPMIVLDDADVFAAAQFAVASSFENAGQMCTSTERVYVDEKIAEQFEQAVVSIASQYKVGSWRDSRVNIGPLVNTKQHAKVVSHIEDALGKGATLLFGERKPLLPFIPPTVISNINPTMIIESEETFGPVVAIDRFSSLDDVIKRANDSVYGLGAVVFGERDAKKVAQQLQAGMIGINQGVGAGGDAPWVGAKQSGFGFHGSVEGHRQFAQVTVINH